VDHAEKALVTDTTDLIIVGAGGHGREALSVARRAVRAGEADWNILGFVDDGEVDAEPLERLDAPVLGGLATLTAPGSIHGGSPHVIAVGSIEARREIDARIGASAPAAVLVDPTAWIGEDVELAPGVMLYPGSRCTTNVRIGRHTHVNCGVTISHDCRVGDHVSLSPGVLLNGGVVVGNGAFLGSGAIVLPGCNIGEGAIVAAGAVVTSDVRPGLTLVGVPARPAR